MISPDLTLTQVEVEKGRAALEVDELHDQNDLQVIDAGVTTRLDKTGYYEFDANHLEAMVYKGMAKSEVTDGEWREIKGHHELALIGGENGKTLATEKFSDFDTKASDDLYTWSSLRSQYLAEPTTKWRASTMARATTPAGSGIPMRLATPTWAWNLSRAPLGRDTTPFGWGGFYGGGW